MTGKTFSKIIFCTQVTQMVTVEIKRISVNIRYTSPFYKCVTHYFIRSYSNDIFFAIYRIKCLYGHLVSLEKSIIRN